MSRTRSPYPPDGSDEARAFVAPYLTLLSEDGGPRRHDLRAVYNGVRYIVKTGAHWRALPHDLPPWPVVYGRFSSPPGVKPISWLGVAGVFGFVFGVIVLVAVITVLVR